MTGVQPLGPAVKLLLHELGVQNAHLPKAFRPLVLGELLAALPVVHLLEAPKEIEDALVWNLVATWLAKDPQGQAFVAGTRRSSGAQRLIAMRGGVPLEAVRLRKLAPKQHEKVEATAGGLDTAPVIALTTASVAWKACWTMCAGLQRWRALATSSWPTSAGPSGVEPIGRNDLNSPKKRSATLPRPPISPAWPFWRMTWRARWSASSGRSLASPTSCGLT